jgi:hypothetical protein
MKRPRHAAHAAAYAGAVPLNRATPVASWPACLPRYPGLHGYLDGGDGDRTGTGREQHRKAQ